MELEVSSLAAKETLISPNSTCEQPKCGTAASNIAFNLKLYKLLISSKATDLWTARVPCIDYFPTVFQRCSINLCTVSPTFSKSITSVPFQLKNTNNNLCLWIFKGWNSIKEFLKSDHVLFKAFSQFVQPVFSISKSLSLWGCRKWLIFDEMLLRRRTINDIGKFKP